MKKVIYTSFTAVGLLLTSITGLAQSVGIGTTTPSSSAGLDITATNKGLLIPRVNLSGSTDAVTISSPATSLLVYNTNATLGAGYYFNSGTPASPVWSKLLTAAASSGWGLNGNAGTGPNSFIGNTDNNFIRFRSNNAIVGNLSRLNVFFGDSAGIAVDTSSASDNIGIGTYALAYPDDPLAFPVQGFANIGIGTVALSWTAADIGSVGIGFGALEHNEDYDGDANLNTAVGTQAGNTMGLGQLTDATFNTAIGSFADCYDTTADDDVINSTAIGSGAWADQSNMVRIGDDFVETIGGVQDWSTLSDGRFKKDIRTETAGLNFIMQLRPVNYRLDYSKMRNYRGLYTPKNTSSRKNGANFARQTKFDNKLKTSFSIRDKKVDEKLYNGLIAQEVEAAAKKSGYQFSGVVKPANPNGRYALRYATFVVPLIEAVQEQQKTIEAQNLRIEALEKRLLKLEQK